MKYWIYLSVFFFLLISSRSENCTVDTNSPKECYSEGNPNNSSNQCCYLTFKTSGRFYSFCYEFEKGKEFEKEVDRLKDIYSKVNVDCLSSWISNELILLLSLFFFALL